MTYHAVMQYIALLRGINVGGNKIVPMADLKKMLGKMGYKNVKTILASGNVLLEARETKAQKLAETIGKKFEETFGFNSHIIVRTAEQIKKLVESEPFKGITVTADTRLYITFLTEKPKSVLQIPYTSPDGGFQILAVNESEVCSVLTLSPKSDTVKSMAILEKEFGKNITTRNWNTVMKFSLRST